MRLKGQVLALRRYGWTGVAVLVSIDVITLGTAYAALASGVDLVQLLRDLPLPTEWLEAWLEGRQSARKAGTFALAYFLYKVLFPVRIVATMAVTPYVYRYIMGRDVGDADRPARAKQ